MNRLMVPPLPAASRPSNSEHVLGAAVGRPGLELQQFHLQQVLDLLVLLARHPLLVRVVLPPGVDREAVGPEQDRVVVVVLTDGVALDVQQVDVLPHVLEHAPNLALTGEQVMRRVPSRSPPDRRGTVGSDVPPLGVGPLINVETAEPVVTGSIPSHPAVPIASLDPCPMVPCGGADPGPQMGRMETQVEPKIVHQVNARVHEKLPDVSVQAIEAEVNHLFREYANSKVRAFLPILVERDAVEHLGTRHPNDPA